MFFVYSLPSVYCLGRGAMTPDWHEGHQEGFFDNLPPLSKRVPIWHQGDRENQTIGAISPWLGIDNVECEVSAFTYLVKTSHTANCLPSLSSLLSLWAPWDDDLSELVQFHLIVFQWDAYKDILNTIQDDAVNMTDDGNIPAENRHQTFVTIHYLEASDLIDTIGGLNRSLMALRADHEELLERFETYREYTGRIMEYIASRDPAMAGPFGLLLRPEDLAPERTQQGPVDR